MTDPTLVLGPSQLDLADQVMANAFMDDPVWAFLVDDPATRNVRLARFFGVLNRAAVSWGWLHATSGIESVTLWSPPERSLVPDEHIGALLDVVPEIAPGTEERIHQFFGRVEEHHPTAPHWYLSVFATDTAHRGRGLGMSLLRRDLEIVDGTHLPCYLESSNPANEDRYRSVGFETIGAFPVCDDGPTMTMMWRDAR